MEKIALEWWELLSSEDKKVKTALYLTLIGDINRPLDSKINTSDILKIWISEHRDLPKYNEQLQKDMDESCNWFINKTYLEQHALSDKYFDSKHPSLLSNANVFEIWKKEMLLEKPKLKNNISILTKIEEQLLENQKVILETLHNLVESTQYFNDKISIEKKLRDRIIATDTVLKINA